MNHDADFLAGMGLALLCAIIGLGVFLVFGLYPSWKAEEASEKQCHDQGGVRVKVMGGYQCIITKGAS